MDDANKLDVETVLEALEVLNDGIAIYDESGRPLFVNQVAMDRFNKFYTDLINGVEQPRAIASAVRRATPEMSEEEITRRAESIHAKYLHNETYPTTTEDGRYVLATFRPMSNGRKAGISIDVTDLRNREIELKKARKQAEMANASKSAFLANMSHEIRTPLNGVMGMAQVLEGTNLDAAQKEFVSTIIESGKTLMALLNDVLDLSKIEAGKFDIVASDANLAHVLRRQLKLWRPRAEEKGLELTLAFDADLPGFVSFDQVRVQQCISNLVSNAIKFTEKGRVEIFASATALSDQEHLIRVRVRDTGPGMDDETLDRLFKPFAQADETISRSHGGTGLGLSITRRLAEMMGGTATAESEKGRGSTFTVSFRAGAAQPRAAAPGEPVAQTGDILEMLKSSNLRVLLVDDHPINRQVAALFLRPFNMHIVEAVDGAEALEALERQPFDIVLMDMHMPVMDGPTAVARIRNSHESWSSVPVIALTADAMSGDKERYLAMGMTGYLSKPLAERELLAEIARVRGEGAWIPTRQPLEATG
ncbi:MAG: response regulator [Alphaproteobacteria bacterium]|nr:response regulator [Alphaproteobacteria bacterium]